MSTETSVVGGDVDSIFVDGTWRPASGGGRFPVCDPSDGSSIGFVSDGGRDDAVAAIDAARRAFLTWSTTTAYERAGVLLEAHRLLTARADSLAGLMTTEQGKPLRAARTEVTYAADFLIWFAEEAKRIYGRTIPSSRPDQRFLVLHEPVGVVAAITPWNYPISMLTRKIAPALAAGCTVVLKPAEQTPLCAVEVVRILAEAGVPPGVVNLVTSNDPAPIGEEFVTNPAVAKLTFTGSTAVGKMLAGRAGFEMKRVSLELGGHAPFLVFADADPEHAAKGAAMIKLLNAGQACISPNRFYVHRSISDQFLTVLSDRMSKMKVGNGHADGIGVGPLIDADALDRMERQVADAMSKGATVRTGGSRLIDDGLDRGFFYAPTVLAGVTPSMDIFRDETFGPIAPVIEFDSEDEVIEAANDTDYGLASYIYTRDLSRALRVAERLKFGMIGINDINPTSAAAPFGGVKDSGLGREGAAEGLAEYLDTKLVGISV